MPIRCDKCPTGGDVECVEQGMHRYSDIDIRRCRSYWMNSLTPNSACSLTGAGCNRLGYEMLMGVEYGNLVEGLEERLHKVARFVVTFHS